MNLSEAEIQVLATLHGAEAEGAPTDETSLRGRGECYWIFQEDWSKTFAELTGKGLIEGDKRGYRLSDRGALWPMGTIASGPTCTGTTISAFTRRRGPVPLIRVCASAFSGKTCARKA